MDRIRDTDLEGLLLIRGARPQPPRPWAKYIEACKVGVRFLLCLLFLYALYPIVPAMGVSTVCRLPEAVRPSYVCRVGDAHSFKLQMLFDAVESSNAQVNSWYERDCDPDSGRSKLAAPLASLIQHDPWNLPAASDEEDNEPYYRRSKADVLLRAEARRSRVAREAASNLTALCRELGGFRRGASEQTDRDLALSLYRTTGHWARLLHRLRISTIDEERADGLATAFLASVNATFARWAAVHGRVRAAAHALVRLDMRNEEMLEAASSGHDTVLDDVTGMVSRERGTYFAEPATACNLWGLRRRLSVVSREEAGRFLESLEAVQATAARTREDLRESMARVEGFYAPLGEWENRFLWLRVVTKDGLLEDWKRHRSDIVSHAAAWRQYLVGRYNPRDWLLIFQAAFYQGKEIHTWGLVEMLTEPLLTAVLIDSLSPLPEDGVFWLHHVTVLGFVYFSHLVLFLNTVSFGLAEVPWLTLDFFRVLASFL